MLALMCIFTALVKFCRVVLALFGQEGDTRNLLAAAFKHMYTNTQSLIEPREMCFFFQIKSKAKVLNKAKWNNKMLFYA